MRYGHRSKHLGSWGMSKSLVYLLDHDQQRARLSCDLCERPVAYSALSAVHFIGFTTRFFCFSGLVNWVYGAPTGALTTSKTLSHMAYAVRALVVVSKTQITPYLYSSSLYTAESNAMPYIHTMTVECALPPMLPTLATGSMNPIVD